MHHADLMHTLWESNVAVFKAHITTGPSNKVLDLFWLYDNKGKAAPVPQLPTCQGGAALQLLT